MTRLYDGLLINKPEIEGMLHLARTDPGMLELLEKAKAYYALHGSPAGPTIWAYKPNAAELKAARIDRLMNTQYGL